MITTKLTGNVRVRAQSRLFRKPRLILQVELRRQGYRIDAYGLEHNIDCCAWRDATTEDLQWVDLLTARASTQEG